MSTLLTPRQRRGTVREVETARRQLSLYGDVFALCEKPNGLQWVHRKTSRYAVTIWVKWQKKLIQNRTGWLVNGSSLLQIAIFGIHLSQMDVWNKARKLETFHLTDDIANGLKDKLSKTQHSYGVFKLSRMSSKGSRWASETKWLLLHPSIHPFILLSWVSQASAPTRRTPSVPVCHLDWHHPPRVKPHPCWISHTPAPRVQIRLFFSTQRV